MANGLDSLIHMAEYCHNQNFDCHFTIIGDGADLPRLKSITMDKQLTNITFTPPIQKNELNQYLDKFHFSLISYADVEILDTSSPNKFYDSLAKGLIPILTTHGWMKNFIDRNVCGVVMDRNDIKKTINEIQMIADNPTLLNDYRNNCKKLYDLCFTKEIAIQKLMELIEA
jgi:glycosyltransferase involved in cell wall biosynthesis